MTIAIGAGCFAQEWREQQKLGKSERRVDNLVHRGSKALLANVIDVVTLLVYLCKEAYMMRLQLRSVDMFHLRGLGNLEVDPSHVPGSSKWNDSLGTDVKYKSLAMEVQTLPCSMTQGINGSEAYRRLPIPDQRIVEMNPFRVPVGGSIRRPSVPLKEAVPVTAQVFRRRLVLLHMSENSGPTGNSGHSIELSCRDTEVWDYAQLDEDRDALLRVTTLCNPLWVGCGFEFF
ncbi:hypothetical protein DFP72DRAFT_852316 [Ephemerocybe angulata]|uniref:Uncharacterized protein n=1 Tax=Ephemerocybe angulata TaxID=980116 RepID=A0A8H6M2D8_9AGAR|nr:hypothetical protein DFP72DRAFT_852316 [Tulosesus angulatus]